MNPLRLPFRHSGHLSFGYRAGRPRSRPKINANLQTIGPERIAIAHLPAFKAAFEPALTLGRGAVLIGMRLRDATRIALQRVISDLARGIHRLGQIAPFQGLPALRLAGASPLLALRHAPVEPKRRQHTRHFIDDILADASDARSKHCDASGRTDARHSSECKPNEERTDCWSHEDVRHTSPVSSPDSASRLNSTCGSDVTPTREKKKKARKNDTKTT